VRPTHQSDLPAEFDHIFKSLRQEITYLHGIWIVYRDLFGTPEAVAALDITPGGFSLIKIALLRELVMGVSRITDPKATAGKENLTLKQLLHHLETNCTDSELINDLNAKLDGIDAYCRRIRDVRNRVISHLDLKTALRYQADPLPNVSSADITEALRRLVEFMTVIQDRFTTVAYDYVLHISPPPRNIVHAINQFKRLQKLEMDSR
jgi:hypothetical protein